MCVCAWLPGILRCSLSLRSRTFPIPNITSARGPNSMGVTCQVSLSCGSLQYTSTQPFAPTLPLLCHLSHGSLRVRSTIRGHHANSIHKLGRAEHLDVCYLLSSFKSARCVCSWTESFFPQLGSFGCSSRPFLQDQSSQSWGFVRQRFLRQKKTRV